MLSLTTPRTVLRAWREADLEPFAALNADSRVMTYFPSLLTREQSDAFVSRVTAHFEEKGWGPWALEVGGRFAGFVGLWAPSFSAHFTPCVEVGWRLSTEFWGHGYATEAARAALRCGFESLGLHEIVSFTSVTNGPSRAVMERLGMHHDPADDFFHPRLPPEHPLARHVLYRITAASLDLSPPVRG